MKSITHWRAARAFVAIMALVAFALAVMAERSQVLIPMDATWRYESSGAILGPEWTGAEYNDSVWPSGQALLGYEEDEPYLEPIRTQLNLLSADGTNQVLTYYFRTSFNFPTNPAGVRFFAGIIVDDAATFHLNGTEVGRLRIPVVLGTDASTQLRETYYELLEFPAAAVREGENVLAVDVYQNSATSSDVMFGLTLIAVWPDPVEVVSGPTIDGGYLTLPTTLRVRVEGSEPAFQWLKNGVPISGATSDFYVLNPTQTSHAGAYSVIVSNTLGALTSGAVTLNPQPHSSTTNAPVLIGAVAAIGSGNLSNAFDLTFSERLERASGTNVSNYLVTENGTPMAISDVLPSTNPQTRIRTVQPWRLGRVYTVSVQNVRDLAGNTMVGVQSTNVGLHTYSTLIPLDQPWRFCWQPLYDDLALHWTQPTYDDSHWWGPFPGVLCSSNVAGWPSPILPIARTIYFRTTFVMPSNIPGRARLKLNAVQDDSAVFYLNGDRISPHRVKSSLPLTYNDFSTDFVTAWPPDMGVAYPNEMLRDDLLRPGTNVLAAELHQSTESYFTVSGRPPFRPDVVFGASLEGWVYFAREIGPLSWQRDGSDLILSWPDSNAEIESADSPSGPWQTQPTTGNTHRHPLTGPAKFFRLRERNL